MTSSIAVVVRRSCVEPGQKSAETVLGHSDQACVAAAIHLQHELSCPATAIAMGPGDYEDRVLAMALHSGCQRAIRIHDRIIDELDTIARAHVFAAAVRHLGATLVIASDRSPDEGAGILGPAIAHELTIPHLTGVIDIRSDSNALLVRRRSGEQLHDYRCQQPFVACVLTFARSSERATHPQADSVSRTPAIEEFDLIQLGVDRESLQTRQHLVAPAVPVQRPPVEIAQDASDLLNRLGWATPAQKS